MLMDYLYLNTSYKLISKRYSYYLRNFSIPLSCQNDFVNLPINWIICMFKLCTWQVGQHISVSVSSIDLIYNISLKGYQDIQYR